MKRDSTRINWSTWTPIMLAEAIAKSMKTITLFIDLIYLWPIILKNAAIYIWVVLFTLFLGYHLKKNQLTKDNILIKYKNFKVIEIK